MGNVTRGARFPDWIELIPGRRPVLLVAPHGGRRPAISEIEVTYPRKVNDLKTAEFTRELAGATSASAIINPAEDRNRIDLNRVSHVRRHAPWLIDLLLAAVRTQVAQRGEAAIFFIHGWNAIPPVCDVGIGARLDGRRLAPVRRGVPSVGPAFLPRLFRFAARCESQGISVTLGDRFPAADHENLLQVFTSRYAEDPDPRIRELSGLGAAGKVSAVQLELSVPLRWIGPLRSSFLETATRLCCDDLPAPSPSSWVPPSRARLGPTERVSLQFHDGAASLGGFAAFEALSSGRRHARLLFFLGGSKLALVTAEERASNGPSLACGGATCTRLDGGRLRLDYSGPCLVFSSSDAFLDLEAGLASSELSDLDVALDWIPRPVGSTARGTSPLGELRGRIEIGGSRFGILTVGSLDTRDAIRPPEGAWKAWRRLRTPLGDDVFVNLCSRVDHEELTEGEVERKDGREPILSGTVKVRRDHDGRTPLAWRVDVVTRSGPLQVFGHVTHAAPVVRADAAGRRLFFLGLARFSAGARVGYGTFEDVRRLDELQEEPSNAS